MSQFRFARLGLLAALLGLNVAPVFLGASTAHAADTSVRKEVGDPLNAAKDDIKKGKYKEALAEIHKAETAESNKTPYETYLIDYMRAAAAPGAGDTALAAKSYEAVISSGRLAAGDQSRFIKDLGDLYYRAGDYQKATVWMTRYLKEGGEDSHVRPLLIQSYFLSGDYGRASKEAQTQIQADERAGRTPTDEDLQMYLACASKLNDKVGIIAAYEKTVAYHPKKEYWVYLLNHLEGKSGFNDTRFGLDVFRLKMAVGAVTTTNDFMNMAEQALQAGYSAEAKKIIDTAFKTGAFGSGAEAARQKRLQDLAAKSVAEDMKTLGDANSVKDGAGMVKVGYEFVTSGQFDKGIALMEQGIAKGDLKHPDEATLHLALAYLQADKKSKALQTFKKVQGTDGATDIAHYWILEISHPLS